MGISRLLLDIQSDDAGVREKLRHLFRPPPRARAHIENAGGSAHRRRIVALERLAQDEVLEVEAVHLAQV